MKKISKIIFGLFLFTFIFVHVDAATTIKESSSDYSNDMIIIGSTRFSSDTIITAAKAANAGINEAKLAWALGKEIADLKINVYYYDSVFEEWSEVTEEGTTLLDEDETEILEKNLNIFFVENEEKILEIPYTGSINEQSLTNLKDEYGVIYKDGKFIFGATVFEFNFETEEGKALIVNTKIDLDASDSEDNMNYGNFEIMENPYITNSGTSEDIYLNQLNEYVFDLNANSYENEKVDFVISDY